MKEPLDEKCRIEQALSSLDVPNVAEVGPDALAEQIVAQMLDSEFFRFIQDRYTSLAATDDMDDADTRATDSEVLMRYVVCMCVCVCLCVCVC